MHTRSNLFFAKLICMTCLLRKKCLYLEFSCSHFPVFELNTEIYRVQIYRLCFVTVWQKYTYQKFHFRNLFRINEICHRHSNCVTGTNIEFKSNISGLYMIIQSPNTRGILENLCSPKETTKTQKPFEIFLSFVSLYPYYN